MIKLKVHQARNLKEKVQGLIGSEEAKNFMLKTHFGIHTIGLKFPIDIVILSNELKVVVTKESLMPNRIFLWNPKYSTVLELPEGTIKKEKITLYKTIEFI